MENKFGVPELGALEVWINGTDFRSGFHLFSKLKTGNWPAKGLIKKRLKNFASGKELNFYNLIEKKEERLNRDPRKNM